MLKINEKYRKASIIDLRQSTNHPCSLLYSEMYNDALIVGKLTDGRIQPGFRLVDNPPFVLAAKRASSTNTETSDTVGVIEKVLSAYYEMVKPESAAEWLGLHVEPDNKLAISPPWAAVFPWRARSLESYRAVNESAASEEKTVDGMPLDITNGWLFCGPISPAKRKNEAMRLESVLTSIIKNGYKRSDDLDGDIIATALVDDSKQWKWLVARGVHRASAASALGYEKIPIRINLVIRRNDVEFWPNVVNGLYTIDNALKVFDQYFSGVAPPIANKWNLQNL